MTNKPRNISSSQKSRGVGEDRGTKAIAGAGGGVSSLYRIRISFLNKESDPFHLDSISRCLIKSGMTPASPLLMVIISTPPSTLTPPLPILNTQPPPIILIYLSPEGPAMIFTQRQEEAARLLRQLHSQETKVHQWRDVEGYCAPIFRAGYGTRRRA